MAPYSPRIQALAQLLAQVWLIPSLSRRGGASLTGELAPGLAQTSKCLVLGRAPSSVPVSLRSPPRRADAAFDYVFALSASVFARDVAADEGRSLCASLAGCAPEFGEPHLYLTSDADPFRVKGRHLSCARVVRV